MSFSRYFHEFYGTAFTVLFTAMMVGYLLSLTVYAWRWLRMRRKGTIHFISPDGKRRTTKRLPEASIFHLMEAIDKFNGDYR